MSFEKCPSIFSRQMEAIVFFGPCSTNILRSVKRRRISLFRGGGANFSLV